MTVKCSDHFSAGILAIHKAARNNVWRQQLVSLTEFLEQNPVWKALPTNADSFQHPIASQLLQH